MKTQRGVTLTSLIIYIIGMLIVITTVATLTTFFYKNVNVEDIQTNSTTQFTSFSSAFSTEINNKENDILDCKTSGNINDGTKVSYIVFSSGNQFTFKNNNIYLNNIKICENIEDCDFSYIYENSKYKITVNFKTKNIDMTGDKAIIYNL